MMSTSTLLSCVWVVFAVCLELVPQMAVLIVIALICFQLIFKKLVFEEIPNWPTCCVLQMIFKYPLLPWEKSWTYF